MFIQSEHPAAVLPALDPVGQALKRLIDDANWQPGTFKLNWARLRSLYLTRAYHRAWSNPQDEARARVALGQADREGLSPGDYAIEAILPPDNDDPERLAKYDLLLSNALLNYASDVRLGRVVAGAGESDVDLPVQHYDAVSDLQGALSGGSIAAYLVALPPAQDEYRALRTLLSRYRGIEAKGGWLNIPDGGGDLTARTAQSSHERDRLLIEDETFSADPSRVDGLRDAITRFQEHHGLSNDKHVGPTTLEALNVTVGDRIAQIEANMERWRWMPRTFEQRYVTVNVPSATLEVHDGGTVVLSSRVIVGRPTAPTPIVRALATALTVNPTWHVPAKIARKEIMPKSRLDEGYLSAHHMVMDAASHTLSQLPGPDNSLGVLKIEMADRFDVYLHDTDVRAAFERHSRDSSHGCVRVEQILPLASYALTGTADGAISDLNDAIDTGETRRMELSARLPVYILYWTVSVNDDGTAQFWPDVYLRDQHLRDATTNRLVAQRL